MPTITAKGISGNNYIFEVFEFGTPLKDIQGLYEFIEFKYEGSYVKYVGQTGSFKIRIYLKLQQHENFKRALNEGATHLAVMPTIGLTEQQRIDIETDIRHYYFPPCNEQ